MEITLQKRQTMYKVRKISSMSMVLCAVKKTKGRGEVRRGHGREVKRRKQHVPPLKGTFQKVHATLKACCPKLSHSATPGCVRR